MEATIGEGGDVGGANPLANFRSAVSKDDRFESIMRNGMYFWWFKGKSPPPGWNETADPDLLAGSAASSPSNQEGGDGPWPGNNLPN